MLPCQLLPSWCHPVVLQMLHILNHLLEIESVSANWEKCDCLPKEMRMSQSKWREAMKARNERPVYLLFFATYALCFLLTIQMILSLKIWKIHKKHKWKQTFFCLFFAWFESSSDLHVLHVCIQLSIFTIFSIVFFLRCKFTILAEILHVNCIYSIACVYLIRDVNSFSHLNQNLSIHYVQWFYMSLVFVVFGFNFILHFIEHDKQKPQT